MKIYNLLVLDMDTLEVLEENSFEYFGDIAECGKSAPSSADKKYNARMATIAEAQQAMSEEYFAYWGETIKPYEEAQVAANLELMPFETAAAKGKLESEIKLQPQKTAVSSKFYEEALGGIDIKDRMDTATADVAQSLQGQEAASRRTASRMGINVGSGRFADMLKTSSLDRARTIGGVRATTRIDAEKEEFNRLAMAHTSGLPT